MPINPFVDYQAPQLYAQGMQGLERGISNFGSGLFEEYQKQKEKREKEQRELAHSDMIMDYARKTNQVTKEEWDDYKTESLKKKKDIAFGKVQGFLDRMEMQQKQEQQTAMIAYHNAERQRAEAEAQKAQTENVMMGKLIYPGMSPMQEPPPPDLAQKFGVNSPKPIGMWGGQGNMIPFKGPDSSFAPSLSKVTSPDGKKTAYVVQLSPGKFAQLKEDQGLDLSKVPEADQSLKGWFYRKMGWDSGSGKTRTATAGEQGAGAASPATPQEKSQAITILKQAGQPTSEANIQHVVDQLRERQSASE